MTLESEMSILETEGTLLLTGQRSGNTEQTGTGKEILGGSVCFLRICRTD